MTATTQSYLTNVPAPAGVHANGACLHCGADVRSGETFCCSGCESVYGLLRSEHLERYYELRGESGSACRIPDAHRDAMWVDALDARVHGATETLRVNVDVQGVHCTACVWLMEELFRRQEGARSILINSSTGRVDMVVEPSFDLKRYLASVERFGYLFGPPSKDKAGPNDDLVWRLGLSIALAMNAMIFGFAFYFGLDSGPIHRTFHSINFAFAVVNVFVCGAVFFRGAWEGLRNRVLHLDLPIAIGMLVAFVGSLYSFVFGDSSSSYFDTLNVFVALMLIGRFVQARVLSRNRQMLLANDGVAGLFARKMSDDGIEIVQASSIRKGDRLLLSKNDLLPVEAMLDEESALFSTDWITGESAAHLSKRGDLVSAGSFSCDEASVRLVADRDFDASTIVPLLGPAKARSEGQLSFWQTFSKYYVVIVLALGIIAFVTWFLATRDLPRTLNVVTAVLIGTCPCAFGIATPLAYEMVVSRLRQHGLYARTDGLLDRLLSIRKVVFDKTGTLTHSHVAIERQALAKLSVEQTSVLATLALHSSHPKASGIGRALGAAKVITSARTHETMGKGTALSFEGHEYRFGSPHFATGNEKGKGDVVFSMDGVELVRFSTDEDLAADAPSEIAALRKEGYDVFLLTGDTKERALPVAASCGIPEDHVSFSQSPNDKGKWLTAHDNRDTLMVGDGINDTFAIENAYVSGTPATDRPFVASKADFFLTSSGVAPLRRALRAARLLRQAVYLNLSIGVFYNILALTLAFSGRMSPLLAAVFMPASSLSAVFTTVTLISRRSAWTS